MALINCPECGKEISDTTDKCPHCGYPLMKIQNEEKNNEKKRTAIIAIITLIILAAAGYIAYTDSSGYKAKQLDKMTEEYRQNERMNRIDDLLGVD